MLAEIERRIVQCCTRAAQDLRYPICHSRGPRGDLLETARRVSALYTRRWVRAEMEGERNKTDSVSGDKNLRTAEIQLDRPHTVSCIHKFPHAVLVVGEAESSRG